MTGVRDLYADLDITLGAGDDRNAPCRCFANPDAHKHGDRSASCSVSLTTGAWKCHACGAQGGAYDALLAHRYDPAAAMDTLRRHGLADPTDTPPSPRSQATPKAASAAAQPKPTGPLSDALCGRLGELRGWTPQAIRRLGLSAEGDRVIFPVATADGTDAGRLRYQPNPERRGDRNRKMLADPGTRRELFPPVEQVTGDPIWIVEGEPDAVAALSLDLPAVAVPGASSWRDEWAPRFRDRRVVICADCDTEGRKLAAQAAASLADEASEVRILDLDSTREDGYDIGALLLENRDHRDRLRSLLIDAADNTEVTSRRDTRHAGRLERWQEVLTGYVTGNDDGPDPIPLPFDELNEATYGGVRPGELVVVAGYTSHGKSILADLILDEAATAGRRCHLYMTEMTLLDRGQRLLARRSGVPFGRIRSRNLSSADIAVLMGTIEQMDWAATLAADWTVERVCEDIARHGWDLCVVDLLHGFPYDGERELTAHVKRLATAARASTQHGPGTCLILACHLNDSQMAGTRDVRAPRPGKHSLKGASSIRQDADTIILTHLQEDEHGIPGQEGEVWIAKGRNSGGRSVSVDLNPSRMRFERREQVPTFAEAVA